MAHEIESFLALMRTDRQRSQWSKQCTIAQRLGHLRSEIDEAIVALNRDDAQNLREEIGDILLDTLALLAAAEDEGVGNAEAIANDAREKILRRKDWLLTDEIISPEEEVRRWRIAKAREKR